MELKPGKTHSVVFNDIPLIVPYGIETNTQSNIIGHYIYPLIVPYGIET